MKKVILLSIILLILKPTSVFAKSSELSISPALITVKTQTANEIAPTITLKNLTTQNVSYSIVIVPFHASPLNNGEPVLENSLGKDYNSLFQNISLVESNLPVTQIELAPLQEKNLKLVMDLPNDLKEKDYYFSIIFTAINQNESNSSTTVKINSASGVLVLLSFGKKTDPNGEITMTTSKFISSGPVNFKISIKNTSDNFINAKGVVNIKNVFGQNVGSFDIGPMNILSDSQRIFDDAVWSEKFLLGLYTAQAQISLSPTGPVLTKQITFFALPSKFLGLLLISIVTIIYVISKTHKKRRKN